MVSQPGTSNSKDPIPPIHPPPGQLEEAVFSGQVRAKPRERDRAMELKPEAARKTYPELFLLSAYFLL